MRSDIAHLDGNASNNRPEHLTFLCLEHHDPYDSRSSQSKGFTREELRFYRDLLYSDIEYALPRRIPDSTEKLREFIEWRQHPQAWRSALLNSLEISEAVRSGTLPIDPFEEGSLGAKVVVGSVDSVAIPSPQQLTERIRKARTVITWIAHAFKTTEYS